MNRKLRIYDVRKSKTKEGSMTTQFGTNNSFRCTITGIAMLGLGIGTLLSTPALADPTAAPLVHKTGLVYQGAFRVPQGTNQRNTFNYGGSALAFNSANNSLYMQGHPYEKLTAELKIPAIINSSNIDSLATATLLQGFYDPTEGRLRSINPTDSNAQFVGGHLVHNGKLIVSAHSYYDAANSQKYSHFVRPLSLSTTGQVQGPVLVGSDPHFVGGYMTHVPAEWQSLLGGPALTGMCCLSIISVQSNGPAASVFDPNHIGQINPVPAKQLVGYPYDFPLGDYNSGNQYFNGSTMVSGIVFPNGTRSVLFFGRHGTGANPYTPGFCYGPGTGDPNQAGKPAAGSDIYCYDPTDSSKGTHAYPYEYQVWAYDANDLLAVKRGTRKPYDLRPYAVWTFSLPFTRATDPRYLGGAAYDPQTNRVFVVQQCADIDCAPIIHVFRVLGGVAPSTIPAPVNLQLRR